MNIYLISRTSGWGYDDYDSAVVIAESEEQARMIHPGNNIETFDNKHFEFRIFKELGGWEEKPEDVKVKLIGISEEKIPQVVCASFNAG